MQHAVVELARRTPVRNASAMAEVVERSVEGNLSLGGWTPEYVYSHLEHPPFPDTGLAVYVSPFVEGRPRLVVASAARWSRLVLRCDGLQRRRQQPQKKQHPKHSQKR